MIAGTSILQAAQEAGVEIVVCDGRIRSVVGMWWVQDVIDAVWAHEIEIVALLSTPSVFRMVRHVVEQMPVFLNCVLLN